MKKEKIIGIMLVMTLLVSISALFLSESASAGTVTVYGAKRCIGTGTITVYFGEDYKARDQWIADHAKMGQIWNPVSEVRYIPTSAT
jgi:hypothetical protein